MDPSAHLHSVLPSPWRCCSNRLLVMTGPCGRGADRHFSPQHHIHTSVDSLLFACTLLHCALNFHTTLHPCRTPLLPAPARITFHARLTRVQRFIFLLSSALRHSVRIVGMAGSVSAISALYNGRHQTPDAPLAAHISIADIPSDRTPAHTRGVTLNAYSMDNVAQALDVVQATATARHRRLATGGGAIHGMIVPDEDGSPL